MTLEELDEYLCELETDIEKKVEWTLTDYVSLANAKKYTSLEMVYGNIAKPVTIT